MKDKLSNCWLNKYKLAEKYYKHYGNLSVPTGFKTVNGYEYVEYGERLDLWLSRQRKSYKNEKLSTEQIFLLKRVGMIFERSMNCWQHKYELAKSYYDHNGNLEVPSKFKTKNGYDYDEDGETLGDWISDQRARYKGRKKGPLTKEQINMLEKIGMCFERPKKSWQHKYELAKSYYEYHGNLEVPTNFKTKNGYEYDEAGENLGFWVNGQRTFSKGKSRRKLSEKEIKLLEEIGMRFERSRKKWQQNYDLAAAYYEHHGNLEVPGDFRTVNGYEYDENGRHLGTWIIKQRAVHKSRPENGLDKKQVELLNKIGMRFDSKPAPKKSWKDYYDLAVAYYEHYGNIEVPTKFKTKNGYEYDEEGKNLGYWIIHQRGARYKLNDNQKEKLNELGMRFLPKSKITESKWDKWYQLAAAYYEHNHDLEIKSEFRTFNGYEYDENGKRLGNWIDRQRLSYNNNNPNLTEEQIKKLEAIKMRFEDKKVARVTWMKWYSLAQSYYEHHGNLAAPSGFKTINGYEYDEAGLSLGQWLSNQKSKVTLTAEQIDLLNKLNIKWITSKKKLRQKEITIENSNKIKIKLLGEFRKMLEEMPPEITSEDDIERINSRFIKSLTKRY